MYLMRRNTLKILLPTLLAVLCGITLTCYGLREDNKEKMIILSDTTLYDHKTGVTIFEGHVKVTQGTTLIIADKLTTKTDKNRKINEIIAYGINNVAEYWTLPKKEDEPFHASANIIKYYPKDPKVTLEQNVTATQGKNSFHGELIHYNRQTETLIVPESNTGRAVLIYNPDSKSDL